MAVRPRPMLAPAGTTPRDRRPRSWAPPAAAEWTPPSWEQIVRDHSARVYRLAYRLTGNPHDAEDLTQDVFVRVFRSLHTFQPGTFEGWLHRITTNLFLDSARRKQKIRFDGLADGSDERLPSSWPTPSEQLADAGLDHDVAAALAALPPEFRAAVVLCDIEGLTYEEIAAVLDIKLGTVRSRIHRGRAQLRAALAHRRPTGERARYLGVEVEQGDAPDGSRPLSTGVRGAVVKARSCAELAELRSAFVDGALGDADRERLLAHLVDCGDCRREVAELRHVRSLLTGSTDPGLTPVDLSLPTGLDRRRRGHRAVVDPSVPANGRRRRAAQPAPPDADPGVVGVLGCSLTVLAVLGIGYLAAPADDAVAALDPTHRAVTEFTSVVSGFPLDGRVSAALQGRPASATSGGDRADRGDAAREEAVGGQDDEAPGPGRAGRRRADLLRHPVRQPLPR